MIYVIIIYLKTSEGEKLLQVFLIGYPSLQAALAAPRWVSPSNAENRCWLRKGLVHLLQLD